jgi:hypothetical protein
LWGDIVERWTIRQAVRATYDGHINSSGKYPSSFGRFDYAANFDLQIEGVEVVHAPDAERITIEHTASIRLGAERGLRIMRDIGELVTSVRLEIIRVYQHPPDFEQLGSNHGSSLLVGLINQYGVSEKLDPAWLTSDVVALARGIYEERAFDRMPILADALQDAGCDNDDVLTHCRDASATHVRGCWVVDLVLGKK